MDGCRLLASDALEARSPLGVDVRGVVLRGVDLAELERLEASFATGRELANIGLALIFGPVRKANASLLLVLRGVAPLIMLLLQEKPPLSPSSATGATCSKRRCLSSR